MTSAELPTTPETLAKGLVRRARRARFVGALLVHGAVAAFAAGTLVLLARAVFGVEAERAAWAVLLVPFAVALAWGRAARQPLSRASAAAWLDVRAGGDGTLLTGCERPDERWEAAVRERLTGLRPPRLVLGRRPFGLVFGAAFVTLALLVPVPTLQAESRALERIVEQGLDDLAEELETLEEELRLDPVVAEELEERLEALREDIAANAPEGALEARDRLAERLEAEAERAREAGLAAEESLRHGARDALGGLAGDAQQAFERALEGMQAAGLEDLSASALDQALSARLSEHAGAGARTARQPQRPGLDPELLRRLAEAGVPLGERTREALAGLDAETLAALAEAGLAGSAEGLGAAAGTAGASLDPEALRALAEALAQDPELAAALAEALAADLQGKLGRLADAGLLEDAKLLDPDQLRSLAELAKDLELHTCDDECPPGGT